MPASPFRLNEPLILLSGGLARRVAPVVSGLLLLGLLFVGGINLSRPSGLDDYYADIRDVVKAVPLRIGGWDSFEIEPTPAAQDLLRPNIIVQRVYRAPDGLRSVSLLIVHCGEVRDMHGHYPPNCYPAHGWVEAGHLDRDIEMPGMTVPARDYDFVMNRDGGSVHLRATDLFVLPSQGQSIHRNIEALTAASRSPTAAGRGSAQIQIVTTSEFSEEEWSQLLAEFMTSLHDVLETIGVGPE